MSDSVLLDVHEGVATVTLNEPRIRNAPTACSQGRLSRSDGDFGI